MYRKNTASQFIHVQGVDASTGGIKSGVTWTVRRCIDGTFAAATGTATEDGTTGWYKFAMSQADTNGNNIGFNFTGTGAVPQTVNIITTAADPTDGVRLGLTALPNAAAEAAGGLYTRGTGAGQIAQDANGNVRVNVDTIKTNPVVNAGTITFPSGATLASTTNITAGTITTVTTVTNQLTAAAIATGVWQDATAGDFTAANSVGKSIMNGVSLGTGLTIAAVSGAVGSVTGAVGSVTGNVGGNVVGSVGSVTGAVGSVTGNVGGNVVGSVGSVTGAVGSVTGAVGSVTGNVGGTINGLTATALADFFDTNSGTTYASAVAGSVVKEIADNAGGSSLTAASIADEVQTRTIAAVTTVSSVTGLTASDVGAIKAKTDKLTFDAGNTLDANVQKINDVTILGDGSGTPFHV